MTQPSRKRPRDAMEAPSQSTLLSRITYVLDERFADHKTGWGHPEKPDRYRRIAAAIKDTVPPEQLETIEARLASKEELMLCHTEAHIDAIEQRSREITSGKVEPLDPSDLDVIVCRESYDVARLAAGSVLNAVDAVLTSERKRVFCPVRPPGHHAGCAKAEGFCLFNNIALAAKRALQHKDVERVLIVDWDAHHGNGTQAIFEEDPNVYYFSTHGMDQYPVGSGRADEKGRGAGYGTTQNIPVPRTREARDLILRAYAEELPKRMRTFKPDLVLISAGFDAHDSDPVASLGLKSEDFGYLTSIVTDIASRYAKGRIVSVLEGGYHLRALVSSVLSHLEALGTR